VRTLAVAQTVPVRGDVAANVAQHLRLAEVAAREWSQLVVFPELSLTGYEIGLAHNLAFSAHDPRLAPLRDAAHSLAVTLIVGAPIRLGSQLFIGAFILSPDRSVDLYTKHHLGAFPASASCDGTVPPAEATVFSPGDRNPLIAIDHTLAAVAVCADTSHPSHPQRAASLGATAYLASMFVIPSELEAATASLAGHAADHTMVVAFANFGGPTGGLAAAGKSALWSETGEIIAQLPNAGPGVALAEKTDAAWRGDVVLIDQVDSRPATPR